jgi:ribosome-associated translation inhibitor RaiA
MNLPLQVTFRGMEASSALGALIREKAEELGRQHERITVCRATVELDGRHHRQGRLFRVCLEIKVPGGEIVVGRGPGEHHEYADAYLAVRDAFAAARRQVGESVRQRRGEVKGHPQAGMPPS